MRQFAVSEMSLKSRVSLTMTFDINKNAMRLDNAIKQLNESEASQTKSRLNTVPSIKEETEPTRYKPPNFSQKTYTAHF